MRYPIITIHGRDDIEVTATVENNTKEYLSGKTVTGIVLYVEQFDMNEWKAASILMSNNKNSELLCNKGFSQAFIDSFLSGISGLSDIIRGIINQGVIL